MIAPGLAIAPCVAISAWLAIAMAGCEGGEGGGAALPARFAIAALSSEPRLAVVQSATLAPIVSIALASSERPERIAWAPGTAIVVGVRDGAAGSLLAIDTLSGEPRLLGELDEAAAGLAVTPDGRALATLRSAGALVIIGTEGDELARHAPCAGPTSVIAIDAARALVACPEDDAVVLLELASGAATRIEVPAAPIALARLSGTRALVACADARSASVLALDGAPRALDPVALEGAPVLAASSPDGASAWIAIADAGTAALVELSDEGTVGRSWSLGSAAPGGLVIAPDGADALVTDRTSGRAQVIALATGEARADAPLGGAPLDVAVIERR